MFGNLRHKRKKVLFVGPSGGGKTTIVKRLMGAADVRKTQTAEYYPEFGDTPGEYSEYRLYFGALQVLSADFSCIALVAEPEDPRCCYPPGFGSLFGGKPMIGIITKTDTQFSLDGARQTLIRAGASPIFEVSAHTGQGWDRLEAYIENIHRLSRPSHNG